MATSLQHISEKMMKMDIDKVGAQSLGLSLIPWVPDKFLIKFDPPKIWVVYHFKDHSEKDQYWRDIPLEMKSDSTADSVTEFLFKEHSYYFDSSLVGNDQVKRLVQMIMNKGKKEAKNQEKAGASKDKPKSNRIMRGIEQARKLDTSDEIKAMANHPKLEPLKGNPKGKLEPLENPKKDEGFDLLDLGDDFGEKKEDKKENKIADNYDFDFEFEDPPKKEDGSKVPPNPNLKEDKPTTKTGTKEPSLNVEEKKPVEKKDEKADGEEEEYIVIDGKRFREIQIEGEEEEFLMDDDGNIYDKEGQYIGTAKDGGEEEEEEDDK